MQVPGGELNFIANAKAAHRNGLLKLVSAHWCSLKIGPNKLRAVAASYYANFPLNYIFRIEIFALSRDDS